MKLRKILVVGSSNMDMVVKTDHIPCPGETVLSGSFFMNPGGKGANQAVAVARLGGEVSFISKLGNDIFGKQFSHLFLEEGIDTSYILSHDEYPSGVALITVDKKGENSIVVASGANGHLYPEDITACLQATENVGIMLLQLEIPMETVSKAIHYAYERNIMVILNPAPANTLPSDLLQLVDILTPNRTEAEMISGIPVNSIDSAREAAGLICNMGVKNVIVTMGQEGAVICQNGEFRVIPALVVETVDTTAAGDVFNGALAVALAEGREIGDAVSFASEAAALSVTRLGAQSSIPYRNELIAQKLKLS